MPQINNVEAKLLTTDVPGEFLVTFTERAHGVRLVDPISMVMDGHVILHIAANIIMAQVALKQQSAVPRLQT